MQAEEMAAISLQQRPWGRPVLGGRMVEGSRAAWDDLGHKAGLHLTDLHTTSLQKLKSHQKQECPQERNRSSPSVHLQQGRVWAAGPQPTSQPSHRQPATHSNLKTLVASCHQHPKGHHTARLSPTLIRSRHQRVANLLPPQPLARASPLWKDSPADTFPQQQPKTINVSCKK